MNVLTCDIDNGSAVVAGRKIETANRAKNAAGRMEIGVRPEHVVFADKGIDAEIVKVSDAGRFRIVEALAGGHTVKLLAPEGTEIPDRKAKLAFAADKTRIYRDGWLVGEGGGQ